MLTVAHVDKWNVFKTDKALDQQGLEKFIAECARLDGLDVEKPFPFVLQGEVTDLQTHVINGACPMRPGAKLTADEQPWRYQSDRPMQAKIVGFYAADAVGKLTHPGTSIHAHALFDYQGITTTAHVERVAVGPVMTLMLPRQSKQKRSCKRRDRPAAFFGMMLMRVPVDADTPASREPSTTTGPP